MNIARIVLAHFRILGHVFLEFIQVDMLLKSQKISEIYHEITKSIRPVEENLGF